MCRTVKWGWVDARTAREQRKLVFLTGRIGIPCACAQRQGERRRVPVFRQFEIMLLVWAAMAVLVGRAFYLWQFSKAGEDNDRNYPPKKAVWDRSIMCMRCGTITEQAATATP